MPPRRADHITTLARAAPRRRHPCRRMPLAGLGCPVGFVRRGALRHLSDRRERIQRRGCARTYLCCFILPYCAPASTAGRHLYILHQRNRLAVAAPSAASAGAFLLFLGQRRTRPAATRGLPVLVGGLDGCRHSSAMSPAHERLCALWRARWPMREVGLVAFVVPRDGVAVDTDELRLWLARLLPAPMLPAHIVVADELPRTAGG